MLGLSPPTGFIPRGNIVDFDQLTGLLDSSDKGFITVKHSCRDK